MFIFDLTNPLTLLLVVLATSLLIFLGREVKKSSIAIIPLIAYLVLLVIYVVQITTLSDEYANLSGIIYKSLAIDLVFILITFFSYLWVDDIETRKKNKKSINNCLDWLWKEV